jgi:hypothetical protein
MSDWAGTGTQIGGVDPQANALITLDEIKRWLNLTGTDDDDFFQEQINDWSDTIASRCNRKFVSQDYEDEVHDGEKVYILPRNLPVTDIDSITVDGGALGEDDYTLDKEGATVRLKSGENFGGGPGAVLVTYTGGYDPIPGDLRRAVRQLVALEYYLSGHGRKALAKRGESAQGGNVTYERSPQDQERIIEGLVRRYGRR